jgi:meso-butanediol dehydrogenase/(S,S)-butanediol dehydrogenase/diacetyl reductase
LAQPNIAEVNAMANSSMSTQLQGMTAAITGAGRGIGRGIALVLASRGAAVSLSDVDPASVQEVAAEIESAGGRAVSAKVDVTIQDSLNEWIAMSVKALGKVDICVPNAGVIGASGFNERKDYNNDDWRMTWDINVRGMINTADAIVPHMKERNFGKIVNIASHGGRAPRGVPEPGRGSVQMPYSVSKAAAIQWTHLLAIELGRFNINVNAVCPGRLWTPMWEAIALNHKALNPDVSHLSAREIFDRNIKATMPLGRPQTPEDIGKAVAFLASEDAAQITGQALNVNGGAIMN